MAGRPVYFAITVFFLLHHPCSGVDFCGSISGVLVNYCVSGPTTGSGSGAPTGSGSGTSTGSGSASQPPPPIDVEPCKEYIYNGPTKKMYQYTGSLPFTITIKSTTITGNGITIGRFECQVGAPPEECYIYTVQNSATPPFSLLKDNNKRFGIHGKGSLTFIIYEGDCNPCPGDGSLGSDCTDDECCDLDNSECHNTCVCANGYVEDPTYGVCVECKDYEDFCTSSLECCLHPYMECISDVCVCVPGRVYSGHVERCVPQGGETSTKIDQPWDDNFGIPGSQMYQALYDLLVNVLLQNYEGISEVRFFEAVDGKTLVKFKYERIKDIGMKKRKLHGTPLYKNTMKNIKSRLAKTKRNGATTK